MKQSRMWPHGEPMVPVDWDSTHYLRDGFLEGCAGSLGARDAGILGAAVDDAGADAAVDAAIGARGAAVRRQCAWRDLVRAARSEVDETVRVVPVKSAARPTGRHGGVETQHSVAAGAGVGGAVAAADRRRRRPRVSDRARRARRAHPPQSRNARGRRATRSSSACCSIISRISPSGRSSDSSATTR